MTAATAGLALVLAAALGACSRSAPRRPGDEYLKAIRVEGNRELPAKELTRGLALERTKKRGRAPDPYLVQLDAERIRGEYLRQGFLGIDVRSRVDRAGTAATVVFRVAEGPRAATRVVIRGIPPTAGLPLEQVRAVLPIADGEPFDYATYEAAKPMLLAAAHNAGYAHAKLASQVLADRANQTAVVQLDYDLGPRTVFGEIEVSGVEGQLAEAVRARAQFRPGQLYSAKAIAETQRALYGMARFSTVQVTPDERRGQVVGVKIAVSEAARREVRLGGGFGIDPTAYEVRGRAGYAIAGWPAPLYTTSVDLRPAYGYLRDGGTWQPRMRATSTLTRQDLLWTYARGEAEARYSYIAVEAYTSFGPRARLGFVTPIKTPRLQLGVGWYLERIDFRDISPLIDPALRAALHVTQPQLVGAYTQMLTLDLRDDPLRTRRGVYGELRLVEGTRAAGGSFDYIQFVPELRGYLPIGRVVLAGRARFGAFWGDVPATERFFSGGAEMRGFGERRLSPSVTGLVGDDVRTVPYGGAALVETNVEARIPIATFRTLPIGGVLFLDGGDVRDELSQLNARELLWAAGVGLRVATLVGPVRLDVGYRLNRGGPSDPDPNSRFAFHLSLGEAF